MSSAFLERLRSPQGGRDRRWVYVPYDQLTSTVGPLAEQPAGQTGIVLVESADKGSRRPYHRQKLAMVLANMRHFALEQQERGVAVDYVMTARPCAEVLAEVVQRRGPLEVMEPAERELRAELAPLLEGGQLRRVPHAGWLTTTEEFEAAQDGPPWRMDAFYRHVRREHGLLMDGDRPEGGKYSFDADNRESWSGEPPAPTPPTFPVDDIKREVADLVRDRFRDHPGRLDLEALPATAADAEAAWDWALQECLPHFGPYQDAMSRQAESLFHTRISALLHLHRLLPARVVQDVLEADLPLPTREGFVRQIIGWREFVRHVHAATDGFRGVDTTNAFGADRALPPAFWGEPSGLECLDRVVSDVWNSGYGHHITRLMVLSNLATLLDVDPRQTTDWFWVAYVDAFDWVVEPNVLGMGTYAVGELMTTKPYICGAAYIHRMSDFCGACQFDPKNNCPITSLYWDFLLRHEERLRDNPRLRLPLASSRKRSADQRESDRATYEHVTATLEAGQPLAVGDV